MQDYFYISMECVDVWMRLAANDANEADWSEKPKIEMQQIH